jgi:hypothetical protein
MGFTASRVARTMLEAKMFIDLVAQDKNSGGRPEFHSLEGQNM